jgi:hypothetical protein
MSKKLYEAVYAEYGLLAQGNAVADYNLKLLSYR